MFCKQIRIALINWQTKRKFAKIQSKHNAKLKTVEIQRKLIFKKIWEAYQFTQINDYIICIEFRMHFIASMLPPKLIKKINKYKNLYRQRRDMSKLIALTEIVYLSDIKNIEKELLNLTTSRRKSWF